jgi:hypothetical protein
MTTRTKAPLLVPVRFKGQGKGGMLHDTDYARGATDRDEAQRINDELIREHGDARWGVDYVMEPVEPFTSMLAISSHQKHRSAVYVELVDEQGRRWPMFFADFVALTMAAKIVNGVIEERTYEVCKKGSAYGIRPVKN